MLQHPVSPGGDTDKLPATASPEEGGRSDNGETGSDPRQRGASGVSRGRKGGPIRMGQELVAVRAYRLSHLKVLVEDYLDPRGERRSPHQNGSHLEAALGWLCRAQDANDDGGVAGRYRLDRGWTASYPETTGYIIPTFFDYYRLTGDSQYRDRAIRMADWLLSIQMPDGAFQGGHIDAPPRPIVFNTAQIMKGLVRSHHETGQERYLQAATRAGDWLVTMQDPDGAWRRCTYRSTATVYHTTAAWPLLILHQTVPDDRYAQCAARFLDWACTNRHPNGWFSRWAFDEASLPFTHTIAYAVRGLLESGVLLKEQRYVEAATVVADVLLKRFEVTRFLAARYDQQWKPAASYSCLTGNAQTAIVWLRLFDLTADVRYLNAALKINDAVKGLQDLEIRNPAIRGAIKGSQPILGEYVRHSYPNWATKYFADALMLEDRMTRRLQAEMQA